MQRIIYPSFYINVNIVTFLFKRYTGLGNLIQIKFTVVGNSMWKGFASFDRK
ncbi:MAG: hypothetical protein LWX70_05630 [Sphingobacteriia bacterium]|nr:hypothetical protein [Sphingobacteriia bacterium]